ncbi:orotate phosphoribosyltransferase [archaeon]|jgi:orotate phosphoribosyltransferase|nr:orotate phosphoribosyltransferase [archaeon]
MDYGREIARAGLEIGAIKLNPDKPFTWASGFKMPIYNDNRMFLFHPEHRELIVEGFDNLLYSEKMVYDFIAGTSTSGIPPATSLADALAMPLIYVRDKPKGHGLQNQIEGIDAESDLRGMHVVLIEDLISMGGSSARAVQGIRDAKGVCNNCISIFNYGLKEARDVFNGERSYDEKGNKLSSPCNVNSLLTYDVLLDVAKEKGRINVGEREMLEEWREDYLGWGEKHGFPRVEK